MSVAGDTPVEKRSSWLSAAYRQIVGRPARDSDSDQIFENTVRSLVREIELTAHAVAISCAIANAVEKGVPLVQSETHRHFPDRPKIFPTVLHGGTTLYLDRDSANAFAMLHASAALASELSVRHITMVTVGNCYRLALSGAADAWRTTASQAVEAVKQAGLLLTNMGASYRIADAEGLIARLKAVATGATTGVNPNGRVTVPLIREERQHTRYLKSIPATIVAETFEAPCDGTRHFSRRLRF